MNCGLFHSNIYSHSFPLWIRFSDGVGGGGGFELFSEGIDCDSTFDLWNISEGCKKNWPFLLGEAGVLSVPLIFFSFLLELIRHSNLAFQKQHKDTSVYGV